MKGEFPGFSILLPFPPEWKPEKYPLAVLECGLDD
jgi:hypothetical protein